MSPKIRGLKNIIWRDPLKEMVVEGENVTDAGMLLTPLDPDNVNVV